MSVSLMSSISASSTTITVTGTITDASGPGILTVESEQIGYTGNSANQFFGLVRGYNSTVAAVHLAGAVVAFNPTEGIVSSALNEVLNNDTPDTDALTINNTTPSRGLLVNGKIIARRDNGSSLVVRGLQSPTEGTSVVSSYSGIFTDAGYSDTGTLDTRFILGGNNEMDVDVQSPHQLRLTAGANDTADGGVRVSAVTNVKIMSRGANEADAPKYLIVDRVDETIHADPLSNNSSDVVLKANTGSLHLNYGVTTGAVGLPILTNTQRDAIASPTRGLVIANSDTNLLNWYNGSAWRAINDTAV